SLESPIEIQGAIGVSMRDWRRTTSAESLGNRAQALGPSGLSSPLLSRPTTHGLPRQSERQLFQSGSTHHSAQRRRVSPSAPVLSLGLIPVVCASFLLNAAVSQLPAAVRE